MIRLTLRVRKDRAEVALAELLELVPDGVEETDLGESVEFAVYGAPGELPALPALKTAVAGALVEVRTTEVPDDWADRWKDFHRPVTVGGRLTVRPPWADPSDGAAQEVVIDPGQAFGTGSHATTRLCLELMLELDPAGSFADLGCGSGVLAIAAARLGWTPVLALDQFSSAVDATRANASTNGAEVEARQWNLLHDALPSAETWAANLVAPLLLALARRMQEPPGHVVASGLLPEEVDRVAEGFAERGLHERERRSDGGWTAMLLAARPRP